jgi:HEAT repeat protein
MDRTELPALAARERVMAFLRGHDPETQKRKAEQLDEADFAVIRVIAQEGAATNTEPAIRYNAIGALARGALPTNLNLLVDLAQFGEDFYVRGHAVLALGATGLYLSLATIATHLSAEESFEQLAARRAIALLARRGSLEGLRVHAALIQDGKLREALEHVLDTLENDEHRPDNRPRATSGRERPT